MSDGSCEPQQQADDDDAGAVVGGVLVVAGGDPAPLLEPADTPLDHVAALVVLRLVAARPPRAALLVTAGGDGVGDAASAQQPPAGRVAVAPVGDQVPRPLAWPARPPGRGTPIWSSSRASWVDSWRSPALTTMPSGRPRPSQARCSLLVSPPRLRPSAWLCASTIPLLAAHRRCGGRRRHAGGRARWSRRPRPGPSPAPRPRRSWSGRG